MIGAGDYFQAQVNYGKGAIVTPTRAPACWADGWVSYGRARGFCRISHGLAATVW